MAQGELNTLGDREALQTRREAIQEELDRRRAEYDALGAALAALEQAHSGLQARFSPALNRRAGELLAELTGGKYDKVALTQQFEALAEERDGLQPRRALTLSQGTADQLYLAVRLAVCELVLPAEEPCPLVLDDALANFDDGRCAWPWRPWPGWERSGRSSCSPATAGRRGWRRAGRGPPFCACNREQGGV